MLSFRFYEKGYQEGFHDGKIKGLQDGRQLGLLKGCEIGGEVCARSHNKSADSRELL